MTKQESKLLQLLKKIQLHEDGSIFIDYDELTAQTVHDGTQESVTAHLTKYGSAIRSIMKSLEEQSLIENHGQGYARVTHPGWHARQITIQKAIKVTIRDVLIPILVSVVTVLLTEYIIHTV